MTEPEDVIEIRDPEIDVEEIMNCIRERLAARQQQASAQGQDYLRLVDAPTAAAAAPGLPELYGQLHQLRQSADSLRLSPVVTNWRLPLVNGPVSRLKNMLHSLVLMYVNTLAGRQIAVNRMLSQVLQQLAAVRQADAARIEALEKEVAELRQRLAAPGPDAT